MKRKVVLNLPEDESDVLIGVTIIKCENTEGDYQIAMNTLNFRTFGELTEIDVPKFDENNNK